jgi:hypothetical protein
MVVFRLGEPYPVHNEANGQDKTRADLTPAFFDVCCYLQRPRPAEVALWRGPVEYGVYEAAPGVPFVLVRMGSWLLDVSLNWHLMASTGEREAWSEHEGPTPLSLSLIDAHTNRLQGYRRFTPAPAFVAQLRAIARRQLDGFASGAAVEQAIARAEVMPLAQMNQRAVFYHVP